jgi:hypothetical protein
MGCLHISKSANALALATAGARGACTAYASRNARGAKRLHYLLCASVLAGIISFFTMKPFAEEIHLMPYGGGSYIPRGCARCNGPLPRTSQYQPLFWLLATTCGSDLNTSRCST